jgi:hypothetical protein
MALARLAEVHVPVGTRATDPLAAADPLTLFCAARFRDQQDLVLELASPSDLPSIDARSGDGLDGRRRIGRKPAAGDAGSAGPPRESSAAVANPLTGRGTRCRSRRTTPRSRRGTRAQGPLARGDAPNQLGGSLPRRRTRSLRHSDRPRLRQVRLATPAGAGDRHWRMQSSGRATPRDSLSWQSDQAARRVGAIAGSPSRLPRSAPTGE